MSNRVTIMSRADRQARARHVLELLQAGNPPSLVARVVGLTRGRVRAISIGGGRETQPVPDAWLTAPMWDMDEEARRAAIIRRAAKGARETILRNERVNPSGVLSPVSTVSTPTRQ